jgi:hypothetical protein
MLLGGLSSGITPISKTISHRDHRKLRELKNNIKNINGQIMDFRIASKLYEVCPSEEKTSSFDFSSEGASSSVPMEHHRDPPTFVAWEALSDPIEYQHFFL